MSGRIRVTLILICACLSACGRSGEACWADAHAIFESIIGPPTPGGLSIEEADDLLNERRDHLRRTYSSCKSMSDFYVFDLPGADSKYLAKTDIAVAADDAVLLTALLRKESTPAIGRDVQSYRGRNSLLHLASAAEAPHSAELLIKSQGGVNDKGEGGATPLHVASCRTQSGVEVVKGLLRAGAMVDASDDAGMAALSYAVRTSDHAKATLLIGAGASLDVPLDDSGKRIRDFICGAGSVTLRRTIEMTGNAVHCD